MANKWELAYITTSRYGVRGRGSCHRAPMTYGGHTVENLHENNIFARCELPPDSLPNIIRAS